MTASFTVLGHLHWLWIPAALLLESASMAAFAIMLRRLLAASGASVGVRPMLARYRVGPGAGARAHRPEDTVVPFETARLLVRALPDARLQLVEGAGHHLPSEPAVVADAIAAFLAAAEITDVPDRSASRDVNSSQVLSVLVERGRCAAGSSAMRPEEGKIQVANTRHDRAGGKSARPWRGPQPKMRAHERIAAQRAAHKRAEARRRRLLSPIGAVTAVLAIVVAWSRSS